MGRANFTTVRAGDEINGCQAVVRAPAVTTSARMFSFRLWNHDFLLDYNCLLFLNEAAILYFRQGDPSRAMREKRRLFSKYIQLAIDSAMRFFFHLLYHSLAWLYDLVAFIVSAGNWQKWVIESAKFLCGPRVLELGFGTGHLQEYLAQRGLVVFGLDESQQMSRLASTRLLNQHFPPRLTRGLAQYLPFPGQSFDSIVATFPTLYIVDLKTLSEIQRVLKSNGKLVVLMASWFTGKSFINQLLSLLFRVTHQVPQDMNHLDPYLDLYIKSGFYAEPQFIHVPGSLLFFIVAKKV